ncbi:hypothetical protein AAG565_07510 [Fontimonas sp. SYSU GA230001]|uniref:hypothetical protein n=1 Tax=Fontimonas sp. SYSU GA230001 TaxID=3142450 RepID=UPI0032B542BF
MSMEETLRLHSEFRAHVHLVLRSIVQAITGLEPGPRRLLMAIEAYWEACYGRRDERTSMMAAARRTHSEAALTRQTQIFTNMLASELHHCGVAQPAPFAQSLAQEVRAIARAELMAGHRLPWQRQRLLSHLENHLSCGDAASAA